MDGYDATRKIRQFNTSTPIVALTANVNSEDHKTSLDAGMNQVITKPVQLETLARCLESWLAPLEKDIPTSVDPAIQDDFLSPSPDRSSDQAAAIDTRPDTDREPTIESGKSSMNQAIIDYRQLDNLKRDLGEDFSEIYAAIFDSIDEILGQLRQHPEDRETVTRLFHSIKSPARSLGASQLAQSAELYEKQSRMKTLESIDAALVDLEQHFNDVQLELKNYDPS
jgi:HPt (histidine-containing phosphotransfer) domain-containing protein